MKLVSVGEITLDHYLGLGSTFVGGISLNFAVHAKRAGASEVALISRIGHKDGQQVLNKLHHEAINSSHVGMRAGKTASIDIQVLADGERTFPEGGYQEHVLADFALSEAEVRFIKQQDVLVTLFDSREQSAFGQLRKLDFAGKRVADFGDWQKRKSSLPELFRGFEGLDLIFMSGNEEAIRTLSPYAHTERLIVITLGARGSVALTPGAPLYQAADPVNYVLDATGCGDAFQAAFTVHYYHTGNIKQALEHGSQRAAQVLEHYGAS